MSFFRPLAPLISPNTWYWLAFAVGQIASLRAYHRYVPGVLTPVAVLVLAALCFLISANWNWKPVRSPLPTLAFCLAAALAVSLIYPIADGLKFAGGGSDQDDAIIVGVRALLEGANPYTRTTYFGSPLSPGPGWILLHAPFVAGDVYPFVTVMMALAATLSLVRRTSDWRVGTLFVSLLASSPFFWELMVIGSDLPTIGFAVVVVTTLAEGRTRTEQVAALILAPLLASSRIVMIYLAGVFAAVSLEERPLRALILATVTGLGALALNVAFYLWSPEQFSPLHHLVAMGSNLLSGAWKWGAIGVVIGVLLSAWRAEPSAGAERMLWTSLCLLAPFAILALASLARQAQWDLAAWMGANYLMPVLPPLAAAAALHYGASRRAC